MIWCATGELSLMWSLKGKPKTLDFTVDFNLKLMAQRWINFLLIFLIFGSHYHWEEIILMQTGNYSQDLFAKNRFFPLQYKQRTMGGCRGGSERTLEFLFPSHLHSYVEWHVLWNGSWHVITKNKKSLQCLAQVTLSPKYEEIWRKKFLILCEE